MLGTTGFGKKVIRHREEDKYMEGHLERIRNARPTTTGFQVEDGMRLLNNAKKHRIIEDKFTQIERENRLLLEKITTTMNKRAQSVVQRERNSKSLHGSFRKKQLQNIEIQNAKLLKRLQEKKSDYDVQRLRQDWKKQKAVIKNIANFPFLPKDSSRRKRAISKPLDLGCDTNGSPNDIELVRLLKINGVSMLVTINLNNSQLIIMGDLQNEKQVKMIEIPKQEAMQFIEYECEGKIENLFQRLYFNNQQKILYLLAKDADYDKLDPLQQNYQF